MHSIGFRKRAIATVVSSAIVLSAVSVLGVLVLGWSNSSLLQEKQQIEEVFVTQMNKLHEDLIFDNIWFSTMPPPNHMNVTLTNVGSIGLNVTEIKLVNPTTFQQLDIITYTDGGIIPTGSFSKNVTYAWSTGETMNVIVTTGRGNQFITQVTAP